MSREYATDAIVFGSRKLGEADRIVDLFTAARGRVPTVVKGVRKIKSRWGGRLEPFTHLKAQLHEGRNLHTLTGADTVRTYSSLRDNPASLKAGFSVIEMISRSTPELHRKPRTYNLCLNFLEALADTSGPVPLALAAQLKMLLLAGFLPHLASCAHCGAATGLPVFSAAAGGALCPDCQRDAFAISPLSLDAMKLYLESPLSSAPQTETGPAEQKQIRRAIRELCDFHLGIKLKVEPW